MQLGLFNCQSWQRLITSVSLVNLIIYAKLISFARLRKFIDVLRKTQKLGVPLKTIISICNSVTPSFGSWFAEVLFLFWDLSLIVVLIFSGFHGENYRFSVDSRFTNVSLDDFLLSCKIFSFFLNLRSPLFSLIALMISLILTVDFISRLMMSW